MKIKFKNCGGYFLADGLQGKEAKSNLFRGLYYVRGRTLNDLLGHEAFDNEDYFPFLPMDLELEDETEAEKTKHLKYKIFAKYFRF